MSRSLLTIVGVWLLATWLVGQAWSAEKITPVQEKFFEEKVRPLLSERCWQCHGEKKQESELRLDSFAAMQRGGASGEKLLAA